MPAAAWWLHLCRRQLFSLWGWQIHTHVHINTHTHTQLIVFIFVWKEVWMNRGLTGRKQSTHTHTRGHTLSCTVIVRNVLVLPFWQLDAFPFSSPRHGNNKSLVNQRSLLRCFYMTCKLPPLQHVAGKWNSNACELLVMSQGELHTLCFTKVFNSLLFKEWNNLCGPHLMHAQ